MKRVLPTKTNTFSLLKSRTISTTVKYKYTAANQALKAQAMLQPIARPNDLLTYHIKTSLPTKIQKPITSQSAYSLVTTSNGISKKNKPPSPVDDTQLSVGCGEDSYFTRQDALGIADGVGGWALNHGNSAFYSKHLMHYAQLELNKYDDIDAEEFTQYEQADPVNILAKSYDRTNFDAYMQQIKGSTTACLALLRGDQLKIANLGDCGIAVIRNGEFLFRSEEQQHSFNYPYQLGLVGGDHPLQAQRFSIHVQKGDIILLATDGLFDNLYDEDVLEIVNKGSRWLPIGYGASRLELKPKQMVDELVYTAREVAENSRSLGSPFQDRATMEGLYHQGGKLDDISVVLGVVWDSEDSPDRR